MHEHHRRRPPRNRRLALADLHVLYMNGLAYIISLLIFPGWFPIYRRIKNMNMWLQTLIVLAIVGTCLAFVARQAFARFPPSQPPGKLLQQGMRGQAAQSANQTPNKPAPVHFMPVEMPKASPIALDRTSVLVRIRVPAATQYPFPAATSQSNTHPPRMPSPHTSPAPSLECSYIQIPPSADVSPATSAPAKKLPPRQLRQSPRPETSANTAMISGVINNK